MREYGPVSLFFPHNKYMNAMTRVAAVSKLTFPSYMDEEFDLNIESRRDFSIFCLIDDKLS